MPGDLSKKISLSLKNKILTSKLYRLSLYTLASMNYYRPFYINISYACLVSLFLCCINLNKASAQVRDSIPATSRPAPGANMSNRPTQQSRQPGNTMQPGNQGGNRNTMQQRTVQKPLAPKVDNRPPPSEAMLKKKWTIKRKLVQNTLARYNYYYHAKQKLLGVIHNVSRTGQDNYNYLLPFYPYSLSSLGLSKNELDSVVEKASINIQIHDPRSKWIDDSYLLIGEAYFFQGEWDKAARTFSFINTNFVPKKKNEYKTVIGASEKDQFSIASREKGDRFIRFFKHSYARNDAFVWSAKTLLEEKEYDQARSLMNVLEEDPYFPKRLDGELAEVHAYALYKEERFKEAIGPLQIAVTKKRNRDEKARMAYILGQLYTNYSEPDSAIYMFKKVIATKPDPMMEFQARVQIAKLTATMPGGSLDQSLATLKKMVKKEKYFAFRDAIYYTMGNLVLPTDADAAMGYYHQSLKVNTDNTMQRTLTYKAIADVYYNQRQYRFAKNFYDSTASVMPPDYADTAVVMKRKRALSDVAKRVETIQREDSLQRIAAMPEADRNIYLEKLAADVRKKAEEDKKAKDLATRNEESQFGLNNPFMANANTPANNANSQKPAVGDWYFYNEASKASGYQEFKKRWGNRKLADNWRRSQSGIVSSQPEEEITTDEIGNPADATGKGGKKAVPADSVTGKTLAAGLPLTPEDLRKSNETAEDAWYDLGKLYNDQLDNTELAIETYDTLLARYPNHPHKTEVVYSLYVWNNKLNRTGAADRYKSQIMGKYGDSKYANIIRNGGLNDINKEKKKEISNAYAQVYAAYEDCNYEGALALKKQADSTYGPNYLQPKFDLLEAMTIAKMDTCDFGREPIAAVMKKYPEDPAIYNKAKELLTVIDERNALVVYLAALQIDKPKEAAPLDEDVSMVYPWQRMEPKFDSIKLKTITADSVKAATAGQPLKIAPLPPPKKPITLYKLVANTPHFVVIAYTRTSQALQNEGEQQYKKFLATKHPNDHIQVATYVLSQQNVMLIFRVFDNEDKALDFYDEIRTDAGRIAPNIRPSDYKMFIISRDNFILMNNSKDVAEYEKFFDDNYVTEP